MTLFCFQNALDKNSDNLLKMPSEIIEAVTLLRYITPVRLNVSSLCCWNTKSVCSSIFDTSLEWSHPLGAHDQP